MSTLLRVLLNIFLLAFFLALSSSMSSCTGALPTTEHQESKGFEQQNSDIVSETMDTIEQTNQEREAQEFPATEQRDENTTSHDASTPEESIKPNEHIPRPETKPIESSLPPEPTVSKESTEPTESTERTFEATPPENPNGFKRNPAFLGLKDNTAIDMGPYECKSRMLDPKQAARCYTILDYSRFNYDPYNHRILLFGGGHAATSRTDIDVLDLMGFKWKSLYPTMSCADTSAKNLDARGFHTKSGHPVARHTYDMTVVGKIRGEGKLLLLSTEGFAGTCHKYQATIASVAAYPLTGSGKKWSYGPQKKLPWYYAAAAEFDPVSGMVIVVGSNSKAGAGGMWVYDPIQSKVIAYHSKIKYKGYDNNLVYYPPTKEMFLIARGAPNTIYRITLDRKNWSQSKSTLLQPTGTPPSVGTSGWAYDQKSQIIGGGIAGGVFHTYNPKKNAWSGQKIILQSKAANPKVDKIVHHMLDYDPINNIFVFISSPGNRMWAYRYRR